MRWLHISDLHFHPDKDGRSSRSLRDALPQYLERHIGKVDAVFMTGDFRHARYEKDDPSAAANAVAFLCQIAQRVGVDDPAHIHIVPGNHDLTRDDSVAGVKKILDITEKYHVEIGHFSGEEAFLWERFGFFREVASLLHGADTIWTEDLPRLHPYRCFDEYGIVYMNTAIAMGRIIQKDGKKADDDRGNLVIGNDALDLSLRAVVDQNHNKPIIVLAHHATELFSKQEREAVEEILKKYPVAVYLCGDAHEPWCRRINDVAEVTMGCMKYGDGMKAVFSVGELPPTGDVSITAHEWRSHPDGWNEYTQFNKYFSEIFPVARRRPQGPFGRDALIEDISSYLDSTMPANRKTVEVSGEPGIGKTTVCREVMEKAAPAECFTVLLRGMFSCDAAQDQILRGLGIPVREECPLDAQIEAFAQTKPNVILYLDNAEDPLKDRAFTSWLLESFPRKASWRVIYSTRMSMKHTNVRPFRVPVLDMPDAKAMFRSLFGTATPEDEAALEGLLGDLSCHPLSIVLVAAQRDLYPTVKSLHQAWRAANDAAHDRFAFEDDAGPHASLRAAIQMSFEAIRENRAARVLWGMMSFLPGHMPQAILDLAFSDDPSSAEAAVKTLVKNCLLTAVPMSGGKAGYGMLNPLKDEAFAFDSQEPVRDEAFWRLLRAFLMVFTKANELDARDRQEAHHFALDMMPDVVSFMEGILSKAKGTTVSLALFALFTAMGNYFQHNAIISLDLIEKMIAISIDNNKILAFLCFTRSDLESRLGRIDEAQAHHREAERLYRQERNNLGLANILQSMGDLESRLGQTDEAQAHYREAEGLYRQERANLGMANVLKSMGDLESRLGQIDEAQVHYREAEGLYRQERANLGMANILESMGNLESRLGQIDKAQAHFREAEALCRQERDKLGMANVLRSMGGLESWLGKIDEAQAHYREAEGLYRQERDNLGLANVLQGMGDLESGLGQIDEAQAHYREAEGLYRQERENLGLANVLRGIGDLESRLGQVDEAQAHYQEAEGLYRQEPDNLGLANILQSMGDLESRLGQVDEAQAHYREAEGLCRQKRSNLGLANVLQSMGELERRLSQTDEAQAHYREAEGLYRQERSNLGLANVLRSMGNLESRLGQIDEAQAHYREAGGLCRQERDNLGLANVLRSMGDLERKSNRWAQAIICYLQAAPLYEQEREAMGQAYTDSELGRAYAYIGETEKALSYLERAKEYLPSLPPTVGPYIADCMQEAYKMLESARKKEKKNKRLFGKKQKPQAPGTPT